MAKTASEKDEKKEESWFLRTASDTIFGPTTRDGLIGWAEHGQLLADHQVSTDRKTWVHASTVDFLGICWFVRDGENDPFGPFNRKVAELLIQNGKVSKNAKILSREEAEAILKEPAEEEPATAPDATVPVVTAEEKAPAEKALVKPVETMAVPVRAEDAATLRELRKTCETLRGQLETQTALAESLKKNAEKDAAAATRKIAQLEEKVKSFEGRAADADKQLQLSIQQSDASKSEQAALLARTQEDLSKRDGQIADLSASVTRLKKELQESRQANGELAQANQAGQSAAKELKALQEAMVALQHELEIAKTSFAESQAAEEDYRKQAASTALRATKAETDFTELLNESNARDTEYREKIAALEKASQLPPEEVARFYENRAAIYDLIRIEIDSVTKAVESEKKHLDSLKEISSKRIDFLTDRKQSLMKRLGNSPEDMLKRVMREQVSDPNAARLRTEFDSLKAQHDRERQEAEERERSLHEKIRLYESEVATLKRAAQESEGASRKMQAEVELSHQHEKEHEEERRRLESEREQAETNQQTLLSRIEALEKTLAEAKAQPAVRQAAEARSVKLPSWMRIKG